jgi:predicted phage terminase large subunit-like protein
MNRPATDGRVIIIGSISSPLAFLNRFKKEPHNKVWTVKDYFTKGCQTIWPEKWSNDFLAKKKLELMASPGLYEALYESDTSLVSKYRFRKEWLRYYDEVPKDLAIFTVIDPAIGERAENDFTAIVTGGIDVHGNVFVIDVIKKRFNLETLEMFGALFTIYDVYKPIKIGFETVAFQKFIKLFFESEARKRGKFPQVVEIKHDSRQTKAMRISSLAPLAQGGNLFIRSNHYDLISEWESYPEVEHDDVLDAVSMFKDLAIPQAMSANRGTPHRYQPRNQYINV